MRELRRDARETAELEPGRVVLHGMGDAVIDLGYIDAPGEIKAAMEELHLEERLVVPKGDIAAEADVAVLIVGELREARR